MSGNRPIADFMFMMSHPVQRTQKFKRPNGCPAIVFQPHAPAGRQPKFFFQRPRPDQRDRTQMLTNDGFGIADIADGCS